MKTFFNNCRNLLSTLAFGLLTLLMSTSLQAAGPPVANAGKTCNVSAANCSLTGTVPFTVKFDASQSTCPNGCTKPDSYRWFYADGTATQSGKILTNIYTFTGVFNATLTVTDDTGLTSTAKVTITVNLPPGESLTSYVQACQTQLGFQTIPDNINCYSGDKFATPEDFNKNSEVSDYVGYRKITDQVDMAFACRWLKGDIVTDPRTPISIEMLVHNRSNGNTCFFSAKGFISHNDNLASPVIRSPTSSVASTFWDPPSAVNYYVRCINCHVEGPYIATPTIAPYLAKYGLLNNGHDTGSNITWDDLTKSFNATHVKFHAVVTPNVPVSVFSQWDSSKQSYMNPGDSDCSVGCHVVGTLSTQPDIGVNALGFQAILTNPQHELLEINHADAMAPYEDGSDYRWINLAIPDGGTENETFANALSASNTLVPELLSSCVDPADTTKPGVPGLIEIHAVGNDNAFVVAQPSRFAFLPDRLSKFNLKDGLTCLNSDQDPGRTCANYSVQYECTNNTTFVKSPVSWTPHPLSSDGDHEERNNANPCGSGSTATSIKAFATVNGSTYSSNGPNDRLATFSQYGVTCNNADQPDGKCGNYVVRYSSCTTPPKTQANKTLTNENVPSSGAKQLTAAASSLVKGQGHNGGWNTQVWSIEPITNTEYVRLHNVPNNLYLTVTSSAEQATVGTATFNTSASEMWLIEPVSGSSYVRLKNLFSGKYLTMGDPNSFPSTPDYIPIYSQGRNTGWNTQRWLIQ